MHDTNMDSDFDVTTSIHSLTINNLGSTPFKKMLEILGPLVLTQVPEGDEVDQKRRLDFLLARTANLHAYLRFLWCHASAQRAAAVKVGLDSADDWAKKKEALYELANAVKLKYEAASRRITVQLESDGDDKPDRANYDARRDARDTRKAEKPAGTGTWGHLG